MVEYVSINIVEHVIVDVSILTFSFNMSGGIVSFPIENTYGVGSKGFVGIEINDGVASC